MLKQTFLTIVLMTITSTGVFGETGNNKSKSAHEEESKIMKSLKANVMSGAITPKDAAKVIDKLQSIKELNNHILDEATTTKYKNGLIKTSLPMISWEVVGVSDTKNVFERLERLYTPEGWLVKIISINYSIYHSIEKIKYIFIPDSEHKWRISTNNMTLS